MKPNFEFLIEPMLKLLEFLENNGEENEEWLIRMSEIALILGEEDKLVDALDHLTIKNYQDIC